MSFGRLDRIVGSIHTSCASLSLWLVIGLVFIALSFLLPEHRLPWPGFRQEALASFAFAALAGAACESVGRVIWPRIALAVLACAAIPLVQYAAGLIYFRSDALISACYLAAFACSVCTGATLFQSRMRGQVLTGFFGCIVATAIVSTGLAFSQWLGPSTWGGAILEMVPWGRPYANLGQANHLATLLLLGVAGLLLWFEQRKIGVWTAAGGVAWLGWGVAMTQSRTAWLVIVTVAAWWALKKNAARLRTSGPALLSGLLLFAVAAGLQAPLVEWWLGPQPIPPDGVPPPSRLSPGTRWGHWQILWDAALRAPWAGYGWNQVSVAHFTAAADYPAIREWASHSHTLVLDLLLYNGLPLGVLLCAALVLWLSRRIAACRDAESWCILVAVLALVLHALLEYPLHYTFFLLPAGLLMGFLRASPAAARPPLAASRLTLGLPAIALVALAVAIGLEYLKAEESLRDLELTARRIGPAASELPRAEWYFVDGWAAYHRAVTMTVDNELSDTDFKLLERVVARYTYPNVLERYAHAAALRGDIATAQRTLLHTCKVHSAVSCDGLRARWSVLQSGDSSVRKVTFPAASN